MKKKYRILLISLISAIGLGIMYYYLVPDEYKLHILGGF